MCPQTEMLGYIDPNTSQYVFSLLGPILAFLAATGGLAAAAAVFIRHWIISYFKKASWTKRLVTVFFAIAILAAASVVVWRLIG